MKPNQYALKITKAQLMKHHSLCKRFNTQITFPNGFVLVPENQAQGMEATYGTMYISIQPDGSSHS